ncbi:MAG TPA: BamA/TamA family outer membrane protein [Albitalea sp.]
MSPLRCAFLAVLALAGAARAQPPASAAGDTVVVTPRARYSAGWLHRALLNDGHRDLWATPVRVEVLNLDGFAGGLTVLELGGGQQTRSLRMIGADGVIYAFRSLDKDVSRGIDPVLRRTIAERVLQDQIGSLLPTGALVIAPLLDAAGVLHAHPRLFVMPDDPRLGEFRAEFAGMLGLLEERPNEGADGEPGFAGSTRVTGSDRFLERLEEDARNRLDATSYLRARLIDFLVGDWDRHPDQWRWASFEEGDSVRWLPVPRDRDWAFARLDGLLVRAAGIPFPGYVGFDDEFPSAFRASFNARALDRRLLAELPRGVYEEIARDVRSRLTDAVIADAVRRLPEAHYAEVGVDLHHALRSRRDDLPRLAVEFYALLAGWPDVETTDGHEHALVERLPDGRLRVEVRARARHVFARTFLPGETREVRLYLHGGDDTVRVRGTGPDAIAVRIIGGGGDDHIGDATTGSGVYVYDDRGDNAIVPAPDTDVDTREYDEPAPTVIDPPGARPRDWGAWWLGYPAFSMAPDIGLLIGAQATRYGYGFRHSPWKDRLGLALAVSTSGVVRASVGYTRAIRDRALFGVVRLSGSALEVDRFYGYGNETTEAGPDDLYHARRRTFDGRLLATLRVSPVLDASFGTVLRAHRSVREQGTLIDALQPYGYGDRAYAGLVLESTLDARDVPRAATRGARLHARIEHFPAALDADGDWTALSGAASVYLTPPLAPHPTLALRAGGEHRNGAVPYTEAAYIGGPDNVRGFATRRFAGRSAAWGNAELRVPVARVFLLLPLHVGLIGLADAGRVWVDGENSDRWHGAGGGGLALSVLSPANAATFMVARSSEGVRFYVRGGFAF